MSDDGFIGLPPGMAPPKLDTDSSTVRVERSTRAEREITFFPAGAGPQQAESESPARRAAPAWRAVIPGHDEPVLIEQVLFLGRNPSPTPGREHGATVALDDPAKSVSKTHAMLEVDAEGLWAHDLDSTNGVWVVPEGGDPTEVVPGRRIQVPPGAQVELGDFVIRIEHA